MNILSYNPGHDGAIAFLKDGELIFSIESEKNSHYRYSPISSHDVFKLLDELTESPDVLCTGGWWPRDINVTGGSHLAGYRGVSNNDFTLGKRNWLGKEIQSFSSTHERSHILCGFGLSDFPIGTPHYALLWEGEIGAFYEVDSQLNIRKLADVLSQPGNRYGMLYGLADSSFPKTERFSRMSDAGKLMALASFAVRRSLSIGELELMNFLLKECRHFELSSHSNVSELEYYNVGFDNQEFRNFAGIFSDKIFDVFFQFAKANMKRGMPLIITGGCGLNCDWNTKWRESNLFSEIFVPPVANDSGSAIGTAIDAQFNLTGNPKVVWNVYSGLDFIISDSSFDISLYDVFEENNSITADMLSSNLILGWVNGKYEIGPRALGNRSILASPFEENTRKRLNEIKQREEFRPIAPVCLAEDAEKWFTCKYESPYMLYTYTASTRELAAVTHVNGTSRLQTVSSTSNKKLYDLLLKFKQKTGYGVLCNTSLNFKGKGFINNINDLSAYTIEHKLDGFVVNGKSFLLKSSANYQAYKQVNF